MAKTPAKKRPSKSKKIVERYKGIWSSDFLSVTDNLTKFQVHSTKGQLNFHFLTELFQAKNYETLFSLKDPRTYVEQNLSDFITREEDNYYLTGKNKVKYFIPRFSEVLVDLCTDIDSYDNLDYFKKFLVKLLKNESTDQIPHFLEYLSTQKFMVNEDGNLFAYKAVKENFRDKHSGTFDNSIGVEVTMPRKDVTQNPNETCAPGLHVGNLNYIHNFWNKSTDILLAVTIDPRDLVSVPGVTEGKIRVCKYKVLCRINFDEALRKNKFLTTKEFVDLHTYVDPYKLTKGTSKKKVIKKVKSSSQIKLETVNPAEEKAITTWITERVNKTGSLLWGSVVKAFNKAFPGVATSSTLLSVAENNFDVKKEKVLAKSKISVKQEVVKNEEPISVLPEGTYKYSSNLEIEISSWVSNKLDNAKNNSLTWGTICKSFYKDFPLEDDTNTLKTVVQRDFNFEKAPKLAQSVITFKDSLKGRKWM